jgi:hypothetical protein
VENAAVAAVIDDLDTYWSQTLPQIAGTSFTPLRGGAIAVDSADLAAPTGSGGTGGTTAPCVSSPAAISGNAFYCPDDDGIVFDSSALVPVLLGHYGSAGLVAAFAHEFGHAIQARIGPTAKDRAARPADYPSLLIEGQGDCYAGSFLAWVIAGHAVSIHLTDGAMLAAIGPLVDFRDPVTVAADDPTAHGWGLDRLDSILLGYRDGAAACHAMTVASEHAIQGTVAVPRRTRRLDDDAPVCIPRRGPGRGRGLPLLLRRRTGNGDARFRRSHRRGSVRPVRHRDRAGPGCRPAARRHRPDPPHGRPDRRGRSLFRRGLGIVGVRARRGWHPRVLAGRRRRGPRPGALPAGRDLRRCGRLCRRIPIGDVGVRLSILSGCRGLGRSPSRWSRENGAMAAKKSKQQWSELPVPARVAIVTAGAMQVGLLMAAQIDIGTRPAEQIRGPKIVWRLISLINFFGPLAYFTRGRR